MKITFGPALDVYKPRRLCFNHLFCGPAGLAKALEQRLGLAASEASSASRTSRFLTAAGACAEKGEKFFSRSLKNDRWGTVVALLSMHDQLRKAG